jgi:hypothetical protein
MHDFERLGGIHFIKDLIQEKPVRIVGHFLQDGNQKVESCIRVLPDNIKIFRENDLN